MPELDSCRQVRDVVLAAMCGRIALAGTLDRLADRLGLPVPELEGGLRELLEAGLIAIEADVRGRLTITQPWQATPRLPSDDELAVYRSVKAHRAEGATNDRTEWRGPHVSSRDAKIRCNAVRRDSR